MRCRYFLISGIFIVFIASALVGYFLSRDLPNYLPDNEVDIEYLGEFPSIDDPIATGNIIRSLASPNYYYLLDQQTHAIWQFSHSGEFIRRISSPGRGPGELVNPLDMSYNNGYLYTFEQDKMQIQRFSEEGEYEDVIILNGAFENIFVDEPYIWLVNHYFQGMPNFIDMPGREGQSIFTVYDKIQDSTYAVGEYPDYYDLFGWDKGSVMIDSFDGKTYVGFRRLPIIYIYNQEGELRHELELTGGPFEGALSRIQEQSGVDVETVFMNLRANDYGIFLAEFGNRKYIHRFSHEGDWETTLSVRDYYQSEFDDRYIRHFDMVETTAGTLRLFVYLYGNNPRSVTFDLKFDQ